MRRVRKPGRVASVGDGHPILPLNARAERVGRGLDFDDESELFGGDDASFCDLRFNNACELVSIGVAVSFTPGDCHVLEATRRRG